MCVRAREMQLVYAWTWRTQRCSLPKACKVSILQPRAWLITLLRSWIGTVFHLKGQNAAFTATVNVAEL